MVLSSKWWRLLLVLPVGLSCVLAWSILAKREKPTEQPPREAAVKVKAYKTRAGVEVREHYRTRPDTSRENNLGGR